MVSFKQMRSERYSVDYRNKKLELQFTHVSAYLQACVIPEDHQGSLVVIVTDLKFFRSVFYMVVTLSARRPLLFGDKYLMPAAMDDGKSRQGI